MHFADASANVAEGLNVVLDFADGKRGELFVTLLWGSGASDTGESSWRQLQERAEKIPRDKKHVKGMHSQSHRIEQFNTAQKCESWLTRAAPHSREKY